MYKFITIYAQLLQEGQSDRDKGQTHRQQGEGREEGVMQVLDQATVLKSCVRQANSRYIRYIQLPALPLIVIVAF